MDEEEEEIKQQIQRLNFNAPLLSVRRIPSRPPTAGPLCNPGLVPFTWEQAPGRPKPSPAPTSSAPIRETAEEEEEEDEFSDALSPTDDTSEPTPDISRRSGSFRKDPQLGELMMGRFLAASKAAATGPLQTNASRKDGRDGGYGYGRERKRVPLPFQHQPEFLPKNGGGRGRGGDDVGGGRHFSMACGLVPRFFLLNPVGCLESRGGALDRDEVEHSWDAVYTHKLGREGLVLREDGSRLTGESNRLTYWSDSQSPNGSSSPYYGKGWKSGSFGSYEKSSGSNLDPTPSRGNRKGPGSTSPASDRVLDADYVRPVDTPDSKTSSADETAEADNVVVAGCCRVQPKCCIAKPGLLSCSAEEHCEEIDSKDSKVESDTSLALSLLPLPLPSSPSESWLHRTLPSVSKNPPPRSLLGIQVQHQRRPSWTRLKDSSKW
ncbi:uncharacterized protein M6B38_269285 [Iris pallida]|uniref:Uncharacterized protein n=1 Tax=Iris pallida TaxID=29817 RepID=A0AAX6DGJ0_IRIPA|nr:Uncharacterized protein M6B38_248520 [Iris pallida]KAJ6796421.1 Uncharacterized protein M6B38_218370 [Iris pallida]KAJ6849462.1 uncharacterized protein M6B38_269285 [Iris pallida]